MINFPPHFSRLDSAISGQGFDSLHSSHISPRLVLKEHSAAVKAIAWSPHERNLLATGGGSKDRCIKTWNAVNGTRLKSVETNSQVCISLKNVENVTKLERNISGRRGEG